MSSILKIAPKIIYPVLSKNLLKSEQVSLNLIQSKVRSVPSNWSIEKIEGDFSSSFRRLAIVQSYLFNCTKKSYS